jgi:nucleoside-diphosphate-sugar epimerase
MRTTLGCDGSCSGNEVSGVLVVGAAGLIGRAVLAQAGRTGTVAAIVARASADVPDAHVLHLSQATVDPLARLLERLEPAAIVNSSGRTSGEPEELWRTNVESVAAILEAMRLAAPGARLVHLGSAAEYAETPDDTTAEEAPLAASTPYAASKLAAFKLVSDAGESGLDTVVARVFNPIGPRIPPTSLPGRAARLIRDAVAAGAQTIELGPLGAVRDYVDLFDIATGVQILASEASLAHRVYNVGSGRPTVVRDLVAMIAGRLDFAGEVLESTAGSPRSHDVNRQVADITRIRSTGWMPSVQLATSVDALVSSLVEGAGR